MKYTKQKLSGIVLFIIVSCLACKTPLPSANKSKKENAAWRHVLSKSAPRVKNYWIELIDGDFNFLQEHKVFITERDLPRLKLKPTFVYYLDTASLTTVDNESSLGKLFVLDKTKALNIGMLKDTARVIIYAHYLNNKWSNGHGYSGLWDGFSKRLSDLLRDGVEMYQLEVIAFPGSRQRFMSYIFYVNKHGEFLFLNQNGEEGMLKTDLIALNQRLLKRASSN